MQKKTIAIIFLVSLMILSGCKKEVVQVRDIEGKKILMIIAPTNFRDEEFLHPKEVFEESKASVTVASKGVEEATGTLGAKASVDKDISEVNAADYDAVVFIGGGGSSIYFDDETVLNIAKDAYEQGKVVAAICIAPSILANAGVLEGKKATAFSSEADNINEKSAGYTGDSVTVDGKVITADGPGSAKEFGREIVKALG